MSIKKAESYDSQQQNKYFTKQLNNIYLFFNFGYANLLSIRTTNNY